MEVTLKCASVESDPLTYIGRIAGACTGKEEDGDAQERALLCLSRGHLSVFEHVSLTWDVRGVSRALTHQLVRHRLASFTQESQRYVEFDDFDASMFVVPPDIEQDERALEGYEKAMAFAFGCYRLMIAHGIKAEDARYALPNAMKTNIVVTMNLREFFHFYNLRASKHAQWEIRRLAEEMLRTVLNAFLHDEEWGKLTDMLMMGEVDA